MSTKLIKNIICLLLAAAALLLCAGCGKKTAYEPEPVPNVEGPSFTDPEDSSDPSAGTLFAIRCHLREPLNPYLLESQTNLTVSRLVYEGLFDVSPSFEPVNVLCASYETADNRSFVFHLKDGVKFHNGRPLTAQDAVYSIDLARDSAFYKARLSRISSVTAGDGLEVKITLSSACSALPLLLDVPIIPEGQGEEDIPAGTGPYVPSTKQEFLSTGGSYMYLSAFSDRRDASALPCERIRLVDVKDEDVTTSFETGLIDLAETDPCDLNYISYGGDNEARYYDTTVMQYIGFNSKHVFFSNAFARRAIALAIDRSAIVSECMSGFASASSLPVPPSSPLWSEEKDSQTPYSLSELSYILRRNHTTDSDDDGFFEFTVTGIEVSFTIDFICCGENPRKLAAAEMIYEELRDAGFDISLRVLSWDEYTRALRNGDFDMYYAEVKLTADFDITPLIASGGSLNYGRVFPEKSVEQLGVFLAAGSAVRDEEFASLTDCLAEECPIAPILFRRAALVSRRGTVSGAQPTQYNAFYGFADWIIKKK